MLPSGSGVPAGTRHRSSFSQYFETTGQSAANRSDRSFSHAHTQTICSACSPTRLQLHFSARPASALCSATCRRAAPHFWIRWRRCRGIRPYGRTAGVPGGNPERSTIDRERGHEKGSGLNPRPLGFYEESVAAVAEARCSEHKRGLEPPRPPKPAEGTGSPISLPPFRSPR